LKILIVTDAWYPQINGVVRTYEYLRAELQEMGYTVKIIGPGDFRFTMAMPGYNEIRLTLFPYHTLRRMIESFEPTVLHIATEGPLGLAARRYAVRQGVEFTSCYHTHFPDYAAKRAAKYLGCLENPVRALAIRFVKFFHAPSSCVFVATPSLEETLLSWGFQSPLKRMTRGVREDIFHIGAATEFQTLKRPVALYVGRLAIEKNLEAFLSMPWHGSKVMVGTGPDKEMLEKKFPDAIFVGKKEGVELANHYRSADVMVFPSKTDTFGMVLIESLACGTPVAAYPVTGPKDIITNPILGALMDDLSEAAKQSLTTGTREERAEHVKHNYSWRRAAHQFLETD
jgi:glycosyltransferase involved in cell wall biosynthesis